MKYLLIQLIRLYRSAFSPDRGFFVRIGIKRSSNTCVFYPSCSEYSITVLEKYGFFKGLFLSLRRVFRCHPWQKQHIDLP